MPLDPRPGHTCCPLHTPLGCVCETQSVKNRNEAREAPVRVRATALLGDAEGRARNRNGARRRLQTPRARSVGNQI